MVNISMTRIGQPLRKVLLHATLEWCFSHSAAINQYVCHADINHMIFAVSFAQIVPIPDAF